MSNKSYTLRCLKSFRRDTDDFWQMAYSNEAAGDGRREHIENAMDSDEKKSM